MGTLLDLASLVMIPSGYKEDKLYSVKPTDGSGDLDFTRSNDTATRVNSAGLIEKVRTNLLLQSNTFDTTWASSSTTETGGQAGYDGSSDAWLLDKSGASGNVNQNVSVSGVNAFSVYVKAGSESWVALLAAGPNAGKFFDLSGAGAIGTNLVNSPLDASIESVGDGWFRISITTNGSITQVRIYPAEDDGVSSGTSGNIYIQDAQLESGDIATDYIPTTSAAVSVGPVANVPRLDYTGGGCPKLLLEPQRTNYITYSEQFDNAAWTKTNTSVAANSVTSPEGTQNADTITSTAALPNILSPLVSFASTTNVSIFVKYVSQQWVQLMSGGAVNAYTNFDIQNGVVGTVGSNASNAQIENFGNGWYRISTNLLGFTGNTNLYFGFVASGTAGWNTFDPNFNKSLYAWGCQIEQSSYPTSYINTLGAAVTRGADDCFKTGINSLIGGTSGTIFFDITTNAVLTSDLYKQFFYYTDAGANQGYMYLNSSNVIVTNPPMGAMSSSITLSPNTRYKVALAYQTNNFALYVNGVSVATSSSGTPYNFENLFSLGSYGGTSEFNEFGFNQYTHFPTRLTNTQLAELTTL